MEVCEVCGKPERSCVWGTVTLDLYLKAKELTRAEWQEEWEFMLKLEDMLPFAPTDQEVLAEAIESTSQQRLAKPMGEPQPAEFLFEVVKVTVV